MNFTVLIPARLASLRLPNKPLADIAGLPMIVRVARQALALRSGHGDQRVVVAADSLDIVRACAEHGVDAILTRTDHPSGSDRLAEACELLALANDEIVVNVQGDEPLIDPGLITAVAHTLASKPMASMSTAAHAIDSADDFFNPNVVKLVADASGMALYFSRAAIPHRRDASGLPGAAATVELMLPHPPPLRHIGIYGYRVGFLKQFPSLSQAPMEKTESLEQLRAMWHGHRIAVHVTEKIPGPGVDTPEDLARVRRLLET